LSKESTFPPDDDYTAHHAESDFILGENLRRDRCYKVELSLIGQETMYSGNISLIVAKGKAKGKIQELDIHVPALFLVGVAGLFHTPHTRRVPGR
jgi:hypothetical protein